MEDFNQALALVERAASELQGNPSPEAQQVLLSFQNKSSPYELCKFILERSKVPTAHFQSITTIRKAALREWTVLSPQQRDGIRDFLLHYLITNSGSYIALHHVVDYACVSRLIICKQTSKFCEGAAAAVRCRSHQERMDRYRVPFLHNNIQPQFKESIFQKILSLLSGDMSAKRHAVGLLLALVNEFSSKQTNSETKLPITYHTKCNKSFADKELKQILTWTMAFIHQFITNPSSLQNDATFLGSCLTLAAQILSWDFGDNQSTTEGLLFSSTGRNNGDSINAPLRPPSHYRDIFVNSHDVLLCFFKLFAMVEQNEDLSHLAKVALSQLASLSGNIFTSTDQQIQYLKTFLELLVPYMRKYTSLLSSASASSALSPSFGNQMIGLSNILVRLISNFRLEIFFQLAPVPNALDAFLNELCAFTCGCLQSLKSVEEVEFTWNLDCFNYLTDAWIVFGSTKVDSYPLLPLLVSDVEEFSTEEGQAKWQAVKAILAKYTRNVFQMYVEARIAIAHSELEQDLVDDENCDDKKEFAEQLEAVGRIGRMDPAHALQLLSGMLGDRLRKWQTQVQQRNIQGLDEVLEELHWLVLITGHVLANEPKDDFGHIPSSLYTLSDDGEAVLTTTNSVMAVLQYQNTCLTNSTLDGFDDIVSPLLAETLLWFVSRWSATYLTISRQKSEPSEKLKAAYGTSGGMIPSMMQFFFSSISSILLHWSGAEPDLAVQACDLLLSLSKLPFRLVLLQQDIYQQFCDAYVKQTSPALTALPARLHRVIVESLLRMGSGIESAQFLQQYFQQIVNPIQGCYAQIFDRPDFTSIAQNTQVMSRVDWLVNSLRGVIRAGKGTGPVGRATLSVCLPYLENLSSLVRVYSHRLDIVEDVTALFSDLLLFQIDNMKDRTEVDALLNGLYHFFKALSELSKEKSASVGGKKEKEKQLYREAKRRTAILYNLFYHFISDASGIRRDPQVQERSGQLALFALTTCILPLISEDLMLYAKVRDGYYSVLCGMFEEATSSLLSLSPQIYSMLLASLKYAILSTDTDIARRGLETVCSICTYHQHALTLNALPSAPAQPLSPAAGQCIASGQQVLAEFLQLLFDHVLLSSSMALISPKLLPQASNALFGTICCHQDLFKQLVGRVLERSPQQSRQKIAQEFELLMSADGVRLSLDEANLKKWRKNVVHFLQNTQGLLIFSA